ncbi:MAG: hypothetical protein CPDRYMAC_4477 [uncultured Paraburkholderia sp.]|nr:MAG: hypothetical protein CPDRYDRY_4341 [uncultured Paraburkholderia sp.]CAH2936878.1 MAG: hypothetical protein CPDRYMAC_4477 [uncultured Paraburkholderia sp.]
MAALPAVSLAGCGAGDSISSQSSSITPSRAKNEQTSNVPLQTPEFAKVKFSSVVLNGTKAPNILHATQLGGEALGGYFFAPWIWNSHRINVCWNNAADWNATQREWVKEAVNSTWGANSDVTFEDWTQCPEYDQKLPAAGYPGARLDFTNQNPQTYVKGETALGWAAAVQLRMSFGLNETQCALKDDSGNCLKALPCFNWDDLETCVKTVAVHEFGHLLAFAHEQDRPETPDWCKNLPAVQKEPKTEGSAVYGPWDLQSVMNYCNRTWMGLGVLSPSDINLVQKYYGKLGSKIYSVFTANDPPIVVVQDSKTFEYAADCIAIPNADGFLIRYFAATPDGNKVAFTLVNRQNHNTMSGYIDTRSDTLKLQKTIAEEIVDMQLSSDSKYAYVIWRQGDNTS